jgi:fructose-specific phosphotransferase system IIA component
MNLKKLLNTDVMQLDLPGNSKQEVIESLLDILMKTGKVKDKAAALNALLDREKKMSTGIQFGVAIPHAKTDAVDELLACVAIKKEGVSFEALDGLESKIFIMTLSPEKRTGPHVQFLAEMSKVLQNEVLREKMLDIESEEALLQLILSPGS